MPGLAYVYMLDGDDIVQARRVTPHTPPFGGPPPPRECPVRLQDVVRGAAAHGVHAAWGICR